MGVFYVKRTKDKTRKWPFPIKTGDYTVTPKARYAGSTLAEPDDQVSTRTIIEECRFRSAATAINEATKQIRREWPRISHALVTCPRRIPPAASCKPRLVYPIKRHYVITVSRNISQCDDFGIFCN